MRILTSEATATAFSMGAAIDAVRQGALAYSQREIEVPLRTHLRAGDGASLIMSAHWPQQARMAVKLVSVQPGNRERGLATAMGALLLADSQTGRCLAIFDAGFLTALRTGAMSGLATDLLARPTIARVALFGVGRQARAQLEAVLTVRHVDEVRVFGRRPAAVQTFVDEMSPQPFAAGVRFQVAQTPSEAVSDADVIITATTSATPLFNGRDVRPGTHVNAVGAFTPSARELDAFLVQRAIVIVDTRLGCLEEAGDLLIPLRAGEIAAGHIRAELGELVGGTVAGRQTPEQITVFKSVGSAAFDVAVAAAALDAAERLGLGAEIAL